MGLVFLVLLEASGEVAGVAVLLFESVPQPTIKAPIIATSKSDVTIFTAVLFFIFLSPLIF
jgi:hypothetical protein